MADSAEYHPALPGACGRKGRGTALVLQQVVSPLIAGRVDIQLSTLTCHVLVAGNCWL